MPLLFGLVWSVDGSMNSKNLETDFIYLFLSLFYSSPDKPKYMIRKATQVDMKPPWRKSLGQTPDNSSDEDNINQSKVIY